jgi:hypothetical protein
MLLSRYVASRFHQRASNACRSVTRHRSRAGGGGGGFSPGERLHTPDTSARQRETTARSGCRSRPARRPVGRSKRPDPGLASRRRTRAETVASFLGICPLNWEDKAGSSLKRESKWTRDEGSPKWMFLPLRGLSAGLIAVVAVTSTRTVPALILGNTDDHHDDARAHDRDPKDSGPCRPKRYLPRGVYPPADGKQATDNKGRDASHEPAVYSLAVFSFHLCTSFPFSLVIFYCPWMISSIVGEMVIPGTGTEVLSLPIIGRAGRPRPVLLLSDFPTRVEPMQVRSAFRLQDCPVQPDRCQWVCRARSLLKGLPCGARTRRRRALNCDLER